jgi:hypothetical protein
MLGEVASDNIMSKISRLKIGEENGIVTLYLRDEREKFTDSELRQLKYTLEKWYDIISFRREDRLTMLDMKVRK